MYEMVTRRGPDAYKKLYDTFIETGYVELAQLLINDKYVGMAGMILLALGDG